MGEKYLYPFVSLAKLYTDSKDPEYEGTWVENYQTDENVLVENGILKIYIDDLNMWYSVPNGDSIIYDYDEEQFTTFQVNAIKASLVERELDILL